jgi:hypothetical protein
VVLDVGVRARLEMKPTSKMPPISNCLISDRLAVYDD